MGRFILKEGEQLLKWSMDKFMTQHINFPTRGSNILDLVFTSEPNMVDNPHSIGKLGDSHHDMILFNLNVETTKKESHISIPDFKNSNLEGYKKQLQTVDWKCLETGSVEEAWNMFKSIIHQCMGGNIKYRNKSNRRKPLWMTRNIISIIRKKRRLWNKYTQTREYHEWMEFRETQRLAKKK
jgi:hypothetical protein